MNLNQLTLQATYNFPPTVSSQFQAVLLKNFSILRHSYCGTLIVFLIITCLSILVGWLHFFYVSNYQPVVPGDFGDPLNIPLQSQQTTSQYGILMGFDNNESYYDFGSCMPANQSCSGWLLAFAKSWFGSEAGQLRTEQVVPENTNPESHFQHSYFYPYFENQPLEQQYTQQEYMKYQNQTSYSLMLEETQAKKQEPPINQTSDWYDQISQYQMDRIFTLYSNGVFYSNFSTTGDAVVNYTILGYSSHQNPINFKNSNFQSFGVLQHSMFQAYLRNTFKQQNDQPPQIFGFYKQLWKNVVDTGADASTPMFQCFLLPLCFYLLVPLFSYQLSQEKGDGLFGLQKMIGLNYVNNFWGNFLYYLIMAAANFVIIAMVYAAFQMDLIANSSSLGWTLTFINFVFTSIALAFLISAFTESGRAASIVSILLVIIYAIAGIIISSKSYSASEDDFYIQSVWWSLLPGFSPIQQLIYISSLLLQQDPTNYLHNSQISLISGSNPSNADNIGYNIAISFVIGYLEIPVILLLAIYIDKIMPSQYGVSENYLYMFENLYNRACINKKKSPQQLTLKSAFWAMGQLFICPRIIAISQKQIDDFILENQSKQASGQPNASSNDNSSTYDYYRGKSQTGIDTDTISTENSVQVQQKFYQNQQKMNNTGKDLLLEHSLVASNVASNGTQPMLRVINLEKTFPATRFVAEKKALRGVSYVVGESECLCLLGANGAGKTTQINIISRLYKQTSGSVYICGQPGSSRSAFLSLGICPQFDVLYEGLTVEEHLLFYCRIKGVSPKVIRQHVCDLVDAVGLQGSAQVKSLSGGMRRRVSIAVALCGKPRVLVLDEPSSGLDVITRRAIWNLILRCRAGRAVLLTTHSLEEAEILSTRIAIMADGRIRCIGAQQELKDKFGTGYLLRVVCKSAAELPRKAYVGAVALATQAALDVHAQIQQLSGDLLLIASQQNQLTYRVMQSAKISWLFERVRLLTAQSQLITDWGLQQTSLETVFIRVVSNNY